MDFLQILGTAAMMTLAVICWKMAHPKDNPLYLAVGQTVFKWLFFALVVLVVGRILTFVNLLPVDVARYINSFAFLAAVVCIVVSVLRYNKHGFVDGFGRLMKKNKTNNL